MIQRLNSLLRAVPDWVAYIVILLPIPGLFWQAVQGNLGPNPVEALEDQYGDLGLKLLLASLVVSPLRFYIGLNLLAWRRVLGLAAFAYIAAHFLVWFALDRQFGWSIFGRLLADPTLLWRQTFLFLGLLSLVLFIPLALSSNNWSIRKLGARWRQMHSLTYLASAVAVAHYVVQAKGLQFEPFVHLVILFILLLDRYWRRYNPFRTLTR